MRLKQNIPSTIPSCDGSFILAAHFLEKPQGGPAYFTFPVFPPGDSAAMNPERGRKLPFRKIQVTANAANQIFHDPSMCITHIRRSSAICTDCDGRFRRMEPGERLAKSRAGAGYPSARRAAEAMGANYNTYAQHENLTRPIPRDAAIRYSKFFRVSLEWLLTGRGTSKPVRTQVPIVCYVGAGAEVFAIDDNAQGNGLEQVDAPIGMEDCVGAIIEGNSMFPLRNGWLIFWERDQAGVPEECVGQLCVCQVKDGPLLVKDLRKGSKRGLYRLESWNAETREDVELEWASKIREIRPR